MAQAVKTRTQETDIDKKVKSLLAQMTLEEKVGQMTQITLQAVSTQAKTKDRQLLSIKSVLCLMPGMPHSL
ncbi:MAG: hypothetical protein FD122_2463 [Stygiobacter sp.]|nr:MAG: hypothetical protein FD122_2463 [Stygiobacter sp.]